MCCKRKEPTRDVISGTLPLQCAVIQADVRRLYLFRMLTGFLIEHCGLVKHPECRFCNDVEASPTHLPLLGAQEDPNITKALDEVLLIESHLDVLPCRSKLLSPRVIHSFIQSPIRQASRYSTVFPENLPIVNWIPKL